jgi:hypothetical protein
MGREECGEREERGNYIFCFGFHVEDVTHDTLQSRIVKVYFPLLDGRRCLPFFRGMDAWMCKIL